MNRAIFLDRDGTVIEECGYLSDPERVRMLPGASEALAALARDGWKLIVVSNQSGVGRGLISPRQMEQVQERFLAVMQQHGIPITGTYLCTHTPEEHCQCRKPSPFLLERAAEVHALDLAASWMIGDREGDILCGRNAGCPTIWLRNEMFPVAEDLPTFVARDWSEIALRLMHDGVTAPLVTEPRPQGSGSMRCFITFSCYGAHLHGSDSGSVDRRHNVPGSRLADPDATRESPAREEMTQEPYRLDENRRQTVLSALRSHCAYRGWRLLAAHVRTNHVHAIVEADVRPERVLNQFKSYASRELRLIDGEAPDRKRWARHGSTRWLWNDQDVRSAVQYVVEAQGEPMALFVAEELQ